MEEICIAARRPVNHDYAKFYRIKRVGLAHEENDTGVRLHRLHCYLHASSRITE